jgi:hypothetical protein
VRSDGPSRAVAFSQEAQNCGEIKRGTRSGSENWEDISKSEDSMRAQSSLDALHNRIQSHLDELHADLTQLATDLREANQASSKARKDRMEGFKRALRDILQAADKADKEWH